MTTTKPAPLTGLIKKGDAKASTPAVQPEPQVNDAPAVLAAEQGNARKPRKEPYYKALTLKVSYEDYMAIKRLCFEREATTQELLTEAVADWLTKHGSV